jgi:hypothetical protein
MHRTRCFCLALLAFTFIGTNIDAVQAQEVAVTRGFNFALASFATGAERQAQPNLWVFEIQYKTLRMIKMPITDKKTGVKKDEILYYLVYKIVNRVIEQKQADPEKTPVNSFDKSPVPETFVPEITFATNDNGDRRAIPDSIIPEAQKYIERRERRKLLNTVDIVRKIPQAVAADVKDPPTLHGVAIFKGVNDDTDFFTLYLAGFSNGYKLVKGPVSYDRLKALVASDGLQVGDQVWTGNIKQDWKGAVDVGDLFNDQNEPPANAADTQYFYTVTPARADQTTQVWRKTVMQKYWRPGDRFDQDEREIRNRDEPRWIYIPDDIDLEQESPATASNGK